MLFQDFHTENPDHIRKVEVQSKCNFKEIFVRLFNHPKMGEKGLSSVYGSDPDMADLYFL